jgi:hypothetical protein
MNETVGGHVSVEDADVGVDECACGGASALHEHE